jgi:hypothetical protein
MATGPEPRRSAKPVVGWDVVCAVGAVLYGIFPAAIAATDAYIGLDDAVFLAVIYGWLTASVVLGIRVRKRRIALFVTGAVPMTLISVFYTIFSWPIFLPSALLIILAIGLTPDNPYGWLTVRAAPSPQHFRDDD